MILLVLIAFLINIYFDVYFMKGKGKKQPSPPKKSTTDIPATGPKCPICGTFITKADKLHAIVYTGPEKIRSCAILGCPYCYPKAPKGIERTCPVCHGKLSSEDFLMSNLYTTRDNHNDVNIIGCTLCGKDAKGNFPIKKKSGDEGT